MNLSTGRASSPAGRSKRSTISSARSSSKRVRRAASALSEKQRQPFGAPAVMTKRILNDHTLGVRAVTEEGLYGVGEGVLVGVAVVQAETGVFVQVHPGAQGGEARIARHRVLEMPIGHAPEDEPEGREVGQAVFPVARAGERVGGGEEGQNPPRAWRFRPAPPRRGAAPPAHAVCPRLRRRSGGGVRRTRRF